jgi:6-pyruvoyl-tetrahydropterin synthase
VDTDIVALDDAGIALDLKALKQALHGVIDPLDHTDLNTLFHFTSAESLAEYIYRVLQQADCGSYLTKVKVEETPGCWVSYEEYDEDEDEAIQD